MPTYIVGLERVGYQFHNDVIQYCQATGHPADNNLYKQIFDQCISQILNKMESDFQAFMLNIMELPCWDLIHYLQEPIDYERSSPFKDAFRSFAIWLWGEFQNKGLFERQYIYIFEYATSTFIMVNAYVDAGQAQ